MNWGDDMNFLRQYSILAGVPGRVGFEISSIGQPRPLHISFELEKADTQSSNTGKLQISNLNDEHKAILSEEQDIAAVSDPSFLAGYRTRQKPFPEQTARWSWN